MSGSRSNIIESMNFSDVLKEIDQGTQLLLDLDQTIMQTKTAVGGDAWFEKLIAYAVSVVPDKAEAIATVIAIYHEVQHHVHAIAIEEYVPVLIKNLQNQGIRIIAITARDMCLAEATFRQLNKIDVDFSSAQDVDGGLKLEIGKPAEVYLHKGIIFCSGQPKGDCYAAYLKLMSDHPEKIIMVDDKRKHLESVAAIAAKNDIAFIGYRYGYLDKQVNEFDLALAHQELMVLEERLPEPVKGQIHQLRIPRHCSLIVSADELFVDSKEQELRRAKKM